ncbi:AAA domain-containing protein [Azoarcus sp. TTM-91]|uniref:sigma 54-interacting transcriptional regulator n=1 Tax=Azoarcus sp. TTM-91 TaxID=2691581 RepID=UPI00145EB475|nr:sigma 54-interacting transcriptional regulator [Azoarcus sp. TTM-91]NMG34988.1 AAA domain-containing protein [Azoarcus sp. TTM-91]
MKPASDGEALAVATLIRDMSAANTAVELAGVFVRGAMAAHRLSAGACYWRDASAGALLPLAGGHAPADVLPTLAMDELDNPLVYSLTAAQSRRVERIDTLVDVGEGFERLREKLPQQDALQVTPLFDSSMRAAGVLMVMGEPDAVQGWQVSPSWQLLLQAYGRLLARLQERPRPAKAEPSRPGQRERAGAGRLLAAEFIGGGPAAKSVRNELLRLADSSLSLLLTGETGVGKDHAAWLIHQASSRQGRFVPVNCAAIPKDLIESELFGVVRGAYTGAAQAREGLVAAAHGGTLFLDEIGDMPLDLQGSLLRLLNEKKFRPLGASREQGSDFRLICATHRPLPELVGDGRFREDLYFRIRQQVLHLPPLRERREDIPALAAHILLQFNREHQRNVMGLSERALALLQAHRFPGNVRELRSLVLVAAERAAPGGWIGAHALAELQTAAGERASPGDELELLRTLWGTNNLPEAMTLFERHLLSDRLRRAQGSRRLAAESLGIPKRTLAHKCQNHRLDVEGRTP